MYVIPPYEAGVTLHRLDGTSQFFQSRRLLFNALGTNCLRRAVGPRFEPSLGWRYLIRDANGELLFARDFENVGKGKQGLYWSRWGWSIYCGTGPVPHTGRSRGYNVMRSGMKTAQERRLNAFYDAAAGEPKPRTRRTGSNLPSNYDDLIRGSYGDRSWKRHRNQQWKA